MLQNKCFYLLTLFIKYRKESFTVSSSIVYKILSERRSELNIFHKKNNAKLCDFMELPTL